ncbi:CBF/Mak21 family protein [Colletotrichum higginsianum IMI 349063]|uniref:CBF/Mak21 family protein n=1 Tax=Colletotrichum higginsianum (strain IMI 349063) TaxID=759273 RepID=A0A1B7YTM5_COLHI|nr:CBF/Mak21 family protein [Colletotrichum higginsianum IMI 349063]OBR15248.1 CBF/Mak21 family protein [Colletotrichum higginsianum IMI 349063]
MPAKISGDGLKRKRVANKEKLKKRVKSESESEAESSGDESNDPQAEILLLENEILESKKHYNNISKLIQTTSTHEDEPEAATLACVALCRVFVRLLSAGALVPRKGLPEKEAVVVQWLKERYFEYKSVLVSLLAEEDLAPTMLTLALRCLKAEAQHLYEKEEYIFPQNFLEQIVAGLLGSDSDDARVEFVEKYLTQYDDIRFFTLKAIKALTETPGSLPHDELFDDAFALLSNIGSVPTELGNFYVEKPKKKSHNVNSLHQHKKQGQDAWLAVLKLAATREQRKQVLDVMSNEIAPWFIRPELLADFLTDSYDAGGSISLLALSGVFYLIKERNLDYPSFYTKLYSLLDSEILHSKHRSRFFRLMDTFLSSTHLPAVLVASFIKRLARLSLNAPPSAIVFVVPWMYNILKRHPLCTFMIHRETRDPEAKALMEKQGVDDPFVADEADPAETHAIDSCLWEIVQLQSHYHPNVATIAKIMSEQFTKQSYNIEDFLDHSYGSLLEAEMSKQVRKPPVLEFQIPKKVFLPNDPESGFQDNLVTKLWNFE